MVDIDRPVAAHAHPQCHALFKIAGADSSFEVEGARYPLVDGSGVLVNAWTSHSYPYVCDGRQSRILALYVEPRWLEGLDHGFASAGHREFFASCGIWLPHKLGSLVQMIAEELAATRQDPVRTTRLLEILMIEIVWRFSRYRHLPHQVAAALLSTSDRRIRRAIAILEERAAVHLPMDWLAREVGLSRPHLFELFRRNVSITPIAFKNVIRMERAYQMLLDRPRPIGEIASGLGFTAHAHFTRFFRDHHGVTPEAYRQVAWRLG